jgi:4a-hydroxytetrahydrobiopterin dehydratase
VSRPRAASDDEIANFLSAHPAWRVESGHLVRDCSFDAYEAAIELLHTQVALAERLDHHPVVTVGYRTARWELWTHDRDAITSLDFDYAVGLEQLLDG